MNVEPEGTGSLFFSPSLLWFDIVLLLKLQKKPIWPSQFRLSRVYENSEPFKIHYKKLRKWKKEIELGGVYLSRWGSASLLPPHTPPMSSEAESCDWNTSLHLTRDELQINGGGGGHRGSVGKRGKEEAEEERSLKRGCQNNENKWRRSLLRWRGELHLWSTFAGILPRRSESSV